MTAGEYKQRELTREQRDLYNANRRAKTAAGKSPPKKVTDEQRRRWNDNRNAKRAKDLPARNAAEVARMTPARRAKVLHAVQVWQAANPERTRDNKARSYQNNRERHALLGAAWREANPDKCREMSIKARLKNPGYWVDRYRRDPAYAIVISTRNRLNRILKAASIKKNASTIELLGCTGAEARDYIASLFLPGMSWNRRQDFHVHHIKPIETFDVTDPTQLAACFHYSNLIPLWVEDHKAMHGPLHKTRSKSA